MGVFVIFVPVLGGVVVTFLVKNFAPEARGHGVPEVMDAIYYKEGIIRPVVAAVKSLASAFSIGTGAAVGREGPIIQIGSSLGSTAGQLITMAVWQRITLVAAGAGAGIAATFNTPIGGVIFTVELMMPEVSVRTFLPVALATGTATFVGRLFLGVAPAFDVPHLASLINTPASVGVLMLYSLLGAVAGLAATAFIRSLHLAEDIFDRVRSQYLRHAVGMLIVGITMFAFMIYAGHYICASAYPQQSAGSFRHRPQHGGLGEYVRYSLRTRTNSFRNYTLVFRISCATARRSPQPLLRPYRRFV